MSPNRIAVACAAGLALAAPAAAQDNLIYNPGFEEVGMTSSALPQGWRAFNLSSSDYVDINDPGAFVRTGEKSMRIRPSTSATTRFQGFDTNVFRPDGSDLYDPDYEYLGGDVNVSGWFLVPEGEELANDQVAIKLEFRREPPNFSVYTSFEFPIETTSTGGEWMQFQFTVTDEMMEAVGDFPPYATSVSILPNRFFFGEYGTDPLPEGTVYFDDLFYFQGEVAGGCNDADIAEPFGTLDLADISGFVAAFTSQGADADIDDNNIWDLTDVSLFVGAFTAGCP